MIGVAAIELILTGKKTFCMFVTNRRVLLPSILSINGYDITSVDTFKLLGVTIDNKLQFRAHCANVCRAINSKLFSIDRLFNLSSSVKIQFFKTFVLPYFDYCSSLCIYFNREALSKLLNKYYYCIYKLFNISFTEFTSISQINDFLKEKFNIFSFQARAFVRFSVFTFKMLHFESPLLLKDIMTNNILTQSLQDIVPLDDTRTLRNNKVICTANIDIPKLTFFNYSNQLIKCITIENFCSNLSFFKKYLNDNINFLIEKSNISNFNITHRYFNWVKKS